MKTRIAMGAGAGFVAASMWALVAFARSPDSFLTLLREPVVKAVLYLSCPVAYLGRYYPIKLWCVLLTNAATFALLGFLVETLLAKSRRQTAP